MNKPRTWAGAALGLLGGLCVMTVATDAKADPVGNPGYFEFIVVGGTDSHFRFTSGAGQVIQLDDGTSSHYFYADLDGDGTVSGVGSSFRVGSFSVPGGTVAAQVILQGSSQGFVDVPGEVIELDDARARIRFTWTASAATCLTSVFSMHLSTRNWDPLVQGVCSTGYDESTGEYCMVAGGFVVPQLPASACDNNGNAINSYFNLGVSTGSYMQILGGQTDPIITQ